MTEQDNVPPMEESQKTTEAQMPRAEEKQATLGEEQLQLEDSQTTAADAAPLAQENQGKAGEEQPAPGTEKPSRRKFSIARLLFCLLSCLLIWGGFFLMVATFKLKLLYGPISFDQIAFHLMIPRDCIDDDVVKSLLTLEPYMKTLLKMGAFLGACMLLLLFRPVCKLITKIFRFFADRPLLMAFVFSFFVFLTAGQVFNLTYGVIPSIKKMLQHSTIVDDNYVHHEISDFQQKNVKGEIMADSEKPNLILLDCESLEATFSDSKMFAEDLLAELTALKEKGDFVKDLPMAFGCHFSIASTYSLHYGLPLFVQCVGGSPTKQNVFAGKCTSVFDVLDASGYQTLLLQGSTLKFAGEGTLFAHLKHARCLGEEEIPKSEYPNRRKWGLWDSDLFDKARKEASTMAGKGAPFAMVVRTLDTHVLENLQPGQEVKFYDFRDVIRLQSRLIADFVKWVEEQPFGENTVIVIVGDHNSVDTRLAEITKQVGNIEFFAETTEHRIFNCILHSKAGVPMKQSKAAMFDMAPTMLDALGFQWEDYALGIGHSLYRDTPTLMEKYGEKTWQEEAQKRSRLYTDLIRK